MKVALMIPTRNAVDDEDTWSECLLKISVQTRCPDRLLVIDSESSDSTVSEARANGFEVQIIEKSSFNHGGTRQAAVEMCPDCQVVIFLTQDAILASDEAVEIILHEFSNDAVAAVCGRQLPRAHADLIEAHARIYNYPSTSHIRSYEDRLEYGLKTAFISNSFAAYRVSALKEVGGFPDDVIFGEDMYVATRLLEAGYKIAYSADACVYHSHVYTVFQEFRRYFDMGVFHAREPGIRQSLGSAESEGLKFVRSELGCLAKHAPWRVPEGLFRTACRFTGYKLGLLEKHLPVMVKRRFAMNRNYFT